MRLSAFLGLCIALLFPFVSAAQSIRVDPGSLEFSFQQTEVVDPLDPNAGIRRADIKVSGVSGFTATVDSRQLTINLSQPWIQVSVRNSAVTVTVIRYSRSAMPDTQDYLANITITSGGQKRVVPVLVHVFPQPDFRPELSVLNLPDSKGSFTGTVGLLLSDAAGDAALRSGRSLSVTATPDPLNPDASAYNVQQVKPFPATGPYRAEFAVTADTSLSEGAHSIGITFATAQNLTADLLVNVTVTGTPQPSGPTISGTVRANGQGLPGVAIAFANGPTVTTNSAGFYSATVLRGYSGSATPSLSGFTFNPSSRPYTQVNNSLGVEDYTATAIAPGSGVTVSGRVMTSDGQPVAGALVMFSGGFSTGTDTSGRYTAALPSGYSGSATVLLSGVTASPPNYQYTNLTTNQSGADFTVTSSSYNISGTVRNQQGQPLAGVTISFDNGQYTATDAQGRYSTGLPAGFNGTATPSLSGFTFSPAFRAYGNFSSNASSEDYTAFPASPGGKVNISGTIRNRDGQPVAGVTVSLPGLQPAITDGNGFYSAALDSGYSGTVTPSLAGFTFDPAARTYTSIRQDQSGQDYTAAPSNVNTTVSGIVRDQLGNPLAGVLLAFTGGPIVVSGADGTYSAVLPPGYSGSVTPSLAGYRFDPAPRNYGQLPAILSNEDYTATFRSSPKAEITSPAPGSALGSGRVTFQWTPGSCPSQYYLAIGSQPGGSDLLNEDPGFVTSYTAPSLPTDGRTLYVRLFTKLGGDFQYNDYTFTAASASAPRQAATLLWPSPSSTLTSPAVTFRWSGGSGVTQYYLSIGSRAGLADLINQDAGNALAARVQGLPTDGSPVYVRLLSRIDGEWRANDYEYKSAGGPQAGRAELLSPPGGSTFCSSSVPFQWSRGVNVSQYYMAIGRRPGGNDVSNIDLGTASSKTIDNLPADGSSLYVRLLSLIGAQWFYNDYVFGAAQR